MLRILRDPVMIAALFSGLAGGAAHNLLFPSNRWLYLLLPAIGAGSVLVIRQHGELKSQRAELASAARTTEDSRSAESAARKAALAAAKQYRRIVETTREGIWMIDAEARTTYANRRMEEMLGAPPGGLFGRRVHDFLDDEGRARADAELARRDGVLAEDREARLLRLDGSELWARLSVRPLQSEESRGGGALAIVSDITVFRRTLQALRTAEARLERSEAFHRRVAEASADVVAIVAEDGRILSISAAVKEAMGYDPAMLIGTEMCAIIHPGDLPTAVEAHRAATRPDGRASAHLRILRAAGDWRTFDVREQYVETPEGEPAKVMSCRDITDQLSLQQQFQQAQKMEAIGTLAGGIAHDFNNMLTVINGYGELVLERMAPTDPMRARIEPMLDAGQRAALLTRQLLAFSRKQMIDPRVLDLDTTLEEMGRMLERLLGEDVLLELRPCGCGARVRADPGQLAQVLVNLAVNARDAMPRGGRLVIATATAEVTAAELAGRTGIAPGVFATIDVTDTGEGIAASVLPRIFEPFFTTKDPGRGTGLGLSTVYGIVKQSGGFVTVETEPDRGSTFRVFLPAAAQGVSADAPVLTDAEGGNATVLLVEDDAAVRDLAAEILRGGGYHVLPAAGGKEAERVSGLYAGPIDLLLSDVVMPEQSGPATAARLVVLRPDLKVLFMSGYAPDALARQGGLDAGVPVLAKPFTRDALIRKVRETLVS